ncbi:hypothetical protein Godav_012335 [Gossypium davidsonii]|uniref:Uncharacterized protein n=2 Tax=Gossypium TaxID=3633 RepID=A0A7J8RCY4_GOSDV|nr:hypothetical protein [Gossypium davidsonii]MBA0611665.1 hypothetical protein [Gossypium davidsonii]MBA0646791.1 hypothetical protein [Gossypium klotzschianum]MBA0646793.1 hypothetical protein [Gossypium klotzschianum]
MGLYLYQRNSEQSPGVERNMGPVG